ncbi:MAG: nucleoside triphosphate pyrophosphohydrolase [Bacteroidia bacterium]
MNSSPHLHSTKEKLEAFQRLLQTMDELREQCPWDKKQTMETLRPLTIEETFELADSIMGGNAEEIKKELGDVLLHIVFYARIASEEGKYDIADVCHALVDKLVKRHPHIYGDVKVETEEQVKSNWEQIKQQEGQKSVLAGVPRSLPSMVKAMRLQEKAQGIGFDWPDRSGAYAKTLEEFHELEEQVQAANDPQALEEEFGDLMFSLINYARFLGINPDNALERTNRKFLDRFNYLEERATSNGEKLQEMTLEQMDAYWDEAKEKGIGKG